MTALAFIGAHKRLFAVLGLALAGLAFLALAYLKGAERERQRQEAARAVAIVEAMKTDQRAKDKAAETRLQDAAEVAEIKERLTDAVADLPDAMPSPRRVARACEQLRAQGDDVSGIPACQRPPG